MNKALFITIEGGEGCGKSTQIEAIKNWFEKNNLSYVITREPGGTMLGEDLKKILKNSEYEFSDMAELYLFNAVRVEHVEKVIKPNLEQGVNVICDRYFDSSIAYQGEARGLGYEKVKKICELAVGDMIPDYTFWLDLSPDLAFQRKGGADVGDRIEQAGMEFHKNVHLGYKKLHQEFPNRIIRIDASKSLKGVSCDVEKMLNRIFNIK